MGPLKQALRVGAGLGEVALNTTVVVAVGRSVISLGRGAMRVGSLRAFIASEEGAVVVGEGEAATAAGGAIRPTDGVRGPVDPLPEANGPHTVYRRNQGTGEVSHYQTWEAQTNPRSPHPYQPGVRFDRQGPGHFNRATGQQVPTPHIHDPTAPWGVRPAQSSDIPGG